MKASAIHDGLRTRRLGRPVSVFESVGSTNDVARALAKQGAAEGTTVVAEAQTAGRGRKGRHWASPPGGLWLSIVLRPSLPLEAWPLIGFAAGAGTAAALESVSGKTIQLKWPNDLILDSRKVGGVLVESAEGVVILGIGINANIAIEDLPGDIRPSATTLLTSLGRIIDLSALVREILGQVEAFYDSMHRDPQSILDAWRRRSFLTGRRVQVSGVNSLDGVAEDIDDNGALLIRTSQGVLSVSAGDVSVRETQAR